MNIFTGPGEEERKARKKAYHSLRPDAVPRKPLEKPFDLNGEANLRQVSEAVMRAGS